MALLNNPVMLSWAAFALCAATFGLSLWVPARKLKIALRKLERLERARRTADQNATQTRQRVEQLSIQLAKWPDPPDVKGASIANSGRPAAQHRSSGKPELPSDGFAETMVV